MWQYGMLYKLYKYGIKSKFFKVIKSMYSSIKSCVKITQNTITEMFSCNKGKRQGDGLSPVLFSLFMNDLFSGKPPPGGKAGKSFSKLPCKR